MDYLKIIKVIEQPHFCCGEFQPGLHNEFPDRGVRYLHRTELVRAKITRGTPHCHQFPAFIETAIVFGPPSSKFNVEVSFVMVPCLYLVEQVEVAHEFHSVVVPELHVGDDSSDLQVASDHIFFIPVGIDRHHPWCIAISRNSWFDCSIALGGPTCLSGTIP